MRFSFRFLRFGKINPLQQSVKMNGSVEKTISERDHKKKARRNEFLNVKSKKHLNKELKKQGIPRKERNKLLKEENIKRKKFGKEERKKKNIHKNENEKNSRLKKEKSVKDSQKLNKPNKPVKSLHKNQKENEPNEHQPHQKEEVGNSKKMDKAEKLAKQMERDRLKDLEVLELVKERLQKRIRRSLLVKGNFKDLALVDILALVPGINDAMKFKDGSFIKLEFHSRKLAKNALELLQNMKVEGENVKVDLQTSEKYVREINADPNVLSVEGLSPDVLVDDIKAAFPKSTNIRIPTSNGSRYLNYAHVKFATAEDAKMAILENKKITMKGHTAVVVYAKLKPRLKNRSRSKKRMQKRNDKRAKQKQLKV